MSPTGHSDGADKSNPGGGSSGWKHPVAGSLITGIATLLAAAIGLLATSHAGVITIVAGAQPTSFVTITPPAPTATVTATATATVTVTATPAGNDSGTSGGTAPSKSNPPVRTRGALTIRSDRLVSDDLDSPKPSWLQVDGDGGLEGPAVNDSRELLTEENVSMAMAENDDPTYQECRDTATGADTQIYIGEMTAGKTLCVITTAGRVAALRLVADASSSQIRFHVVVWQPTD